MKLKKIANCLQFAIKRNIMKKKGGVRQFGAEYITGGNPVW